MFNIIFIIAALALAVPADQAINTAIGGTPGKTISGDTARARTKGSKPAKVLCGTYQTVAWYDYIYFSPAERKKMKDLGAKDHCDRWELHEAGVLQRDHRDDWKNLNR